MRTKIILGLTAATFLLLPCVQAVDNYKIDPAHTRVGFSVRHLGISNVKGVFDEFEGALVLDEGKLKEASATIQVKSVNTRVQQRDNHLRTPDFFDAAKYPTITFKTKRIEAKGDEVVMIADFTIRGVTKELRLPVTLSKPIKDPWGNMRIGLEAKAKLNRRDYGINYNQVLESGVAAVGDEVELEINAEAIKETAGEPGKK
jgi:polyisoprenoid-binding protein YceI